MLTLYDYFRSSASYRVRIALAHKGIEAQIKEVHLVKEGGQQQKPAYLTLNPQGLVPTLVVDKHALIQSLAIIDYLEQAYPSPSLFPQDPLQRSHAYGIALNIACDIHPLNNLRVLNYLKANFSADVEMVQQWYHHWLQVGFDGIEQQLEAYQSSKDYCVGNAISIADVCLIPQVYNAIRFELPLGAYPKIKQIYDACMKLPCFEKTRP